MLTKIVRPDGKGRITLGSLAKGVSSYVVKQRKDHSIVLEPYAEIPARERWVFSNKAVFKRMQQGLKDAAEGRVHDMGSFAKYIDEDDQ